MASSQRFSQAGWKLMVAAAAGGAAELVRRRRSSRNPPPPPPVTTQSSPGQIADLQQEYGADMAPASAPPAPGGTENG